MIKDMKKMIFLLFIALFVGVTLSGCDDDEEIAARQKIKDTFKYQVRCYNPNGNNVSEYNVNDYSYSGAGMKIPYVDKEKGKGDMFYLNTKCVIKPNLKLIDKFSEEEKVEFKNLQEKTDFIYEIACRNIGNSGTSTFKANNYVANKNEIALADIEKDGSFTIYKLVNPSCAIFKRPNIWK